MLSVVVINCGYVESSRACLGTAFSCSEEFETEAACLRSLAEWLVAKYELEDDSPYSRASCCKKAKGKFCSNCGRKVFPVPEFDCETFAAYIQDLCCGTADGWGVGWGEPLISSAGERVYPAWKITSLTDIVDNPENVLILSDAGEKHISKYAESVVTGAPTKIRNLSIATRLVGLLGKKNNG